MALSLGELPRYLVLEPTSSVRLEVALVRPACEIDIGLDAPKPGRSFLLLIGPEGGWTDDERAGFTAAGWTPVSLGPSILRTETAALAALAIVSAAWLAKT